MSLVPFTEDNLKLTFHPAQFFKDLESKTGASRATLASTLSRAQKLGLVKRDSGIPVLTNLGRKRIRAYDEEEFQELQNNTRLMVSFDIPQTHDRARRILVSELKNLNFSQLQKSVWLTKYDTEHRIIDIISELKIGKYVTMFLVEAIYGYKS